MGQCRIVGTGMDLFSATIDRMTHANDPATSREAAERMVRSGKRARHARLVLELVTRSPGRTAIELWEYVATDDERAVLKEAQEVRRRLVNLEQDGLVRKGDARLCSVRRTKQVTWTAR